METGLAPFGALGVSQGLSQQEGGIRRRRPGPVFRFPERQSRFTLASEMQREYRLLLAADIVGVYVYEPQGGVISGGSALVSFESKQPLGASFISAGAGLITSEEVLMFTARTTILGHARRDAVYDKPIPKKPPYVSIIRALIEEDKVIAARKLLATAIREGQLEPEILKLQTILAVPKARRSKRTDADRSREYDWLGRHAAEYRGKWLALNGDELIAYADSLKDLRTKLSALKPQRAPLIHYVG